MLINRRPSSDTLKRHASGNDWKRFHQAISVVAFEAPILLDAEKAQQYPQSRFSMSPAKKSVFAQPFYRRHRNRIVLYFVRQALLLTLFVGMSFGALYEFFHTKEGPAVAAIPLAITLLLLARLIIAISTKWPVRILPYFERKLGNADTWLSGEAFLWHSKFLDELALKLGVRPLSEFESGDDMAYFEKLHWHDPSDALSTLDRFLQADVSKGFSAELVSDLQNIRNALASAKAQGVRFCLLVREGNSASGWEMENRKGSFF